MLSKYRNYVFIFAAITLIGLSLFKQLNGNLFSASSLYPDSPFYIDPSGAEADIGETLTFKSYGETASGGMPVKVDWSVSDDKLLDDSNCGKNSNQCTVKTLQGPATGIVTALLDGKKDEARVYISENTYHGSADETTYEEELAKAMEERFYIQPANVILTKGESYTFTSYTETGTSEPKETKSEYWQLDSEYWDDVEEKGEIKDCNDSSTCTFYADSKTGSVALFAWLNGNYAAAYIEIIDSLVIPFTDSIPDWADDYIVSLYNKGIVSGYSDGRYGSSDSVTRGQYIAMLYRTAQYLGFDTEAMLNGKNCSLYTDIKSDHYAYKAICFAKYYNWLGNDFPDTSFKPEEYITRELAASLNFNVALKTKFLNLIKEVFITDFNLKLTEEEINSLYDSFVSDIFHMYISTTDVWPDHKYMEAITLNDYYNIMNGTETADGNELFNPTNSLNRAEAAVTIWRFMWHIGKE